MAASLEVRAGRRALVRIREEGLRPESVKIIAGAAGGPKFLVLSHLDQAIFPRFCSRREEPLFLLGSSIGAWRFAAASRNNAIASLERFTDRYLSQHYSNTPTRDEITEESGRILEDLLGATGIQEILSHPCLRLNLLAVRCRWPFSSDRKAFLMPGILMAALANLINRRFLGIFFERILFFDPRDKPPFVGMSGFSTKKIPLSDDNLKEALMASGSIPLIMRGVRNIPGAGAGLYRDGGVIDYHLDIPFFGNAEDRGLVLYPHYSTRITPGWFDKKLSWKKPSHLDDVVLLSPSRDFIDKLPGSAIPQRDDFKTLLGRDAERIARWKETVHMSRRLGEDFLEALERGTVGNMVMPL